MNHRIGILCYDAPAKRYANVADLLQAGEERGVEMVELFAKDLGFAHGTDGSMRVFRNGEPLGPLDTIFARPNIVEEPTTHAYIATLLKGAGYFLLNDVSGLALTKNKILLKTALAQAGLPTPRWGVARGKDSAHAIAKTLGYPVIAKASYGSIGKGVFYCPDAATLAGVADYIDVRDNAPILLEAFVEEAALRDVRVFLVDGNVIAAMERCAPEGDIRANTGNGGSGHATELTPVETDIAVRAAELTGHTIVGVDLIRSRTGPLVLEMNANPGFNELKIASGVDIPGLLIEYAIERIEERENEKAAA